MAVYSMCCCNSSWGKVRVLQLLLYVCLIADFVSAVLIVLIEPINFFFPRKLLQHFVYYVTCEVLTFYFLFVVNVEVALPLQHYWQESHRLVMEVHASLYSSMNICFLLLIKYISYNSQEAKINCR